LTVRYNVYIKKILTSADSGIKLRQKIKETGWHPKKGRKDMAPKIHLIDKYDAKDIREWANTQQCGREIGSCMVDEFEREVMATGRCRCRQCGEKIKKGEIAIPFFASFTDGSYNSWTATRGYIHKNDCSNT